MNKAILSCFLAVAGAAGASAKTPAAAYRLADAIVVHEDAYEADPIKKWGLAGSRDITNVLRRVTGREIPLYSESRAPTAAKTVIYVGNTRAAKAAGLDAATLRDNQTFRLVTTRGKTFILARTGTAASYGAAEFLRRSANCYFTTISGNDPCDRNPDAVATCCDVTKTPAIPVRNFYFKDNHIFRKTTFPHIIDYTRRLRTNGTGDGYPTDGMDELEGRHRLSPQTIYHTYYLYCSDKKYFKDHPEYFRMNKRGVREARPFGELCLTNPDVKRICYDSLVSFIKKDRAKDPVNYPCIYDFSEMDNSGGYLCKCPECLKVVSKYNRKPGGNWEGGDAGLQLEFVNEMARKIRKEFPDVVIRTFAYVSTEGFPQGIKPEPNVLIQLCDLYSKSDHMRPLAHSFNDYRHSLVKEWGSAARHLQIWDYMLYHGPLKTGFPEVSVDAIHADVEFFRSVGLERYFMETEFHYQPFYELNNFVMAESTFGADKTLDELLDIWCRVYGKGAQRMREAIDLLRRMIAENPIPDGDFDALCSRLYKWRTAVNMRKLRDLVLAARSLETDRDCLAKMAEILGGVDFELMRLLSGKPETADELKSVRNEFLAAEKEAVQGSMAPFAEADRPRAIKNIMKELDLRELRFKDLPEPVAKAPKDSVRCADWRFCYTPEATDVMEDPDSECEKVMRLRKPELVKEPRYFFPHAYPSSTASEGTFTIKKLIRDGKYHWYRLGVGCLGEGGQINFPGNRGCFRLSRFYTTSDGAKTNPNWYEYWVSVKVVEPLESDDFNSGFFMDRLVLRRVDALD
ncbi:MAG: DUF4838 domain-containing protein [Kiritimatiellae bacterium]|nr:DUF4838 domain-containing protein [Kiritimatiellia bacterium]